MLSNNWSQPIKLTGKHITLVPLSDLHCDGLIEATMDGELWKTWYAFVPSPQEMAAEIQRRLALQQEGSMLPFTVIENKTKQILGMTNFVDIMPIHKRLEIGYTWYRKSAQQTVVNTEAKFLLLSQAFEVFECVVVRFGASFFNFKSRRAIERLGAKLDGILRNNRTMPNGVVCDSYAYSIIQSEWPTIKVYLESKISNFEQ